LTLDLTRNARTQAQPCVPCCPPTGNPSALGCCASYIMPEKLTVSLFGYENARWPTPESTSALNIPQYALADFTIQDKVFDITLTESLNPDNAFYRQGWGGFAFARPNRYAYVAEDLPISINCNLKSNYTYSSTAPDLNYVLSYDDSTGPFYLDFGIFCGQLLTGGTGTQWTFNIKSQPGWTPYGSGNDPYGFHQTFRSGILNFFDLYPYNISMNCSPFVGYSSMKPSYPYISESYEISDTSIAGSYSPRAGHIGRWVATQNFGVSTNTYATYYKPSGTMKAIITE
jgi:hypothetical protein